MDVAGRFAKKAEGGAVQSPGSAADDHIQMGTNVQATGDDPANETGKAKGGKEDPGSTHPARTDNTSLEGGKYAYDANTPIEKLAADFREISEQFCAIVALDGHPTRSTIKTAGAKPAAQPQTRLDPEMAKQAGWELAGLLNGTLDKQAADQMVEGAIADVIKAASDDADNAAEYYRNFFAEANKQAEEDPSSDPSSPGASEGAPGASAPPGGGGSPMGMPGGGGGGGAPGPADPSGGAGGDPSGAGGDSGMGPEADMFAQVLTVLGISPEQFQQAVQQVEGGGAGGAGGAMGGGDPTGGMGGGDPTGGMGGGAPPAGGGAPPAGGDPTGGMGGGAPPPGMEVAAHAKTAGDKKQPTHREKAAQMRTVIAEQISRSRGRK
jgi:hypothetical protein